MAKDRIAKPVKPYQRKGEGVPVKRNNKIKFYLNLKYIKLIPKPIKP